jgi:hypothetical protein
MKIKIAERLRPFSLIPGASCVLPGSCFVLEAFPTQLRIAGREWKMPLTGPVTGFTLQQDLEKNCVYVFGKAKEGYFRVRVEASDSGFQITAEKGPLKSAFIEAEVPYVSKILFERLSLGNHKSQDWDQVQRRCDLKEILPVLFCLGQKIPLLPPQPLTGTARLLELPEDRKQLPAALEALFKAAFRNILVPRLMDDQHQGLVVEEPGLGNPFFLLQEGAKRVRALFFKQNERRLSFLPNLPIPFDSGRMLGLQAPGIGEIDIEWSKKILRRVILRATTSGEVLFDLQNEIKSFRVGKKKKLKSNEPLLLEAGKTYNLDRFQK